MTNPSHLQASAALRFFPNKKTVTVYAHQFFARQGRIY